MKAWLRYLLAMILPLTVVVFCNLRPGVYVGTCDGVPVSYTVDADGALGVDCQSVSVVRTTSGGSVTCKERAR